MLSSRLLIGWMLVCHVSVYSLCTLYIRPTCFHTLRPNLPKKFKLFENFSVRVNSRTAKPYAFSNLLYSFLVGVVVVSCVTWKLLLLLLLLLFACSFVLRNIYKMTDFRVCLQWCLWYSILLYAQAQMF